MNYLIAHSTRYSYKQHVAIANHVVCLEPRVFDQHRCTSYELRISPEPSGRHDRVDSFGNHITLFSIQKPHRVLEVVSSSHVEVDTGARAWPERTMAWEQVVKKLPEDLRPECLDAYQYVFESPRIRPSPMFAEYALQSFTRMRPLGEALLDLTARIHREFRFDVEATETSTPAEEVFVKRRGVCQDFAHVEIACVRSLGLAARYVSGYLRAYSPADGRRVAGAAVSHAWVSVYSLDGGWLDVDPTNNVKPAEGHITVGWGRDYGDVAPVRGVILGGGRHTIRVSVEVETVARI